MKYKLTVAAVLAIAAGSALAALPEFESLDANADGFISQEEAVMDQDLMTAFAKADSDKDGKLSPEEYKAIQ